MTSPLLPYQADSILDHPLEGLEIERWMKLTQNLAKFSGAPVVMINHAFERGVEVLATNEGDGNPYASGAQVPLECNIYCHHVIQNNAPLVVTDASEGQMWDDNPEYTEDGFEAYAGVPLEWPDGRVFGTLCVMHKDVQRYDDTFLCILNDYKDIIDFELKLLDQNRRLRALSVIDEMTGLYNRRGLRSASKQLLALSQRYRRSLAVIYIDLDRLKPINDTYGHEVGDEAIRLISRIINGRIREHDIAARMGGDEFVMLCLVEHQSDIEIILKRLQGCLESTKMELPDGRAHALSVSVGYASGTPRDQDELDSLIHSADASMYRVKSSRASE